MVNETVCNHKYSIARLASPPVGKVTFTILEGVPPTQIVSSAFIVPPSVILPITVALTSVLADSQPAVDLQLTKYEVVAVKLGVVNDAPVAQFAPNVTVPVPQIAAGVTVGAVVLALIVDVTGVLPDSQPSVDLQLT